MTQIAETFQRVLDLQHAWSSNNTEEMHRRGTLIRKTGPAELTAGLAALVPEADRLAVEGRDGTGLKTRVPWIRIYDREHSPSATSGWYVVYLFAFDGSSVYLSLNQGTTVPGQFKARPADELAAQVAWARAALSHAGADVEAFREGIELGDNGLGRGYERGNVYAIRYDSENLPDDTTLLEDLRHMLGLLDVLYREGAGRATPVRVQEDSIPGPRPDLQATARFIEWMRQRYGPTLVATRAAAEAEARALLDAQAGRMTRESAMGLGELFNAGEWAGAARRSRFLPAFVGATMQRLVDPLDQFNVWTERLWRAPVDEALLLTDRILRNPH